MMGIDDYEDPSYNRREMDHEDREDRYGSGPWYCTECGKECDTHEEDVGIGSYEFWGARGVDSQMALSSDCCDADVQDYPPDPAEEEPELPEDTPPEEMTKPVEDDAPAPPEDIVPFIEGHEQIPH